MKRRAREEGQVTVLAIGMLIVVLAVSGLAVDGTRAFLERRALQNVADAAALAGADRLDVAAFYEGEGEVIRLDEAAARTAAIDMVSSAGRGARASVEAADGSVEVRLWGMVETQFLRLIGFDVVPVAVVARAESQVGGVPAPVDPGIPAPGAP